MYLLLKSGCHLSLLEDSFTELGSTSNLKPEAFLLQQLFGQGGTPKTLFQQKTDAFKDSFILFNFYATFGIILSEQLQLIIDL